MSPRLPEFSFEPWYSDPRDHRCPHDAWLESLEIGEPAARTRKEKRETIITLKLLGAYHDGWITFVYLGVKSHSIACYQCDQGAGDWLRDEFSVSDSGSIAHRITWRTPTGATSQWMIEAREVSYSWAPFAAQGN